MEDSSLCELWRVNPIHYNILKSVVPCHSFVTVSVAELDGGLIRDYCFLLHSLTDMISCKRSASIQN